MVDTRHPRELRAEFRAGRLTGPTTGLGVRHVQANLVVLPRARADDFLEFCRRNPRPCPLVAVTEPGEWEPASVAPGADLRRDLPRYRVWEHGTLIAEPTDLVDRWRGDLVSFLLGCSFTFEWALRDAAIPLRHVECGRNVSMYKTSIACEPAGPFAGPMVVSMRPIPKPLVERAVAASARFPAAHGAPIHIGDPSEIGIADLMAPDYGDPPLLFDGDVPVFWACGVTPQAVAVEARVPVMMTHAPGCMFITDVELSANS